MKYLTKTKETPLMKQYNEIKIKYPNCLILFRVGDFYEMFGEDAVKASKILNIILTGKSNGNSTKIKMAGFPHHAIDNYIPKLIKAGFRVAICDQLEDSKYSKGIVKRGLTELITPGLTYNDSVIDTNSNNFLASLYRKNEIIGLSFLDISTGEFLTTQGNFQNISKLISNFSPKEIIYCKNQKSELYPLIKDIPKYNLEDWVFDIDYAYEKLITHFKTSSLKGFGIENLKIAIIACGAIMRYLEVTENKNIKHINSLGKINDDNFVWLDKFTIINLELIDNQNKENVSLLKILDKTKTPMGARLLKKWILLPLKNKKDIQFRLNCVEMFLKNLKISIEIKKILENLVDFERTCSKLSTKRISPKELITFKNSLTLLNPLKELLLNSRLDYFGKKIRLLSKLIQSINNSICEEAPHNINNGNFIKSGINEELDKLRKVLNESESFLEDLKKEKINETGINSLKISYNKIFGYYIEVPNTYKNEVPSSWIRKQTLVNAERYITTELKHHEEIILGSGEKILKLEKEIYKNLIYSLTEYINDIQQNAYVISNIDCLLSFADNAIENKYVKPIVDDSNIVNIIEGRHPIIEQTLKADQYYVPNSTFLNDSTQQIIILTGPNMSGKSALLRQVALITLMAQIGSYVPAKKAIIGIVDKIFTRVGASDNISKGESTFMVEMNETANILNNLSEKSLVIMDEIGRGTSTYDGIAIAASIVEYLHEHKYKPRTLFATHYHELNDMTKKFKRIQNFHIDVLEKNDNIIFRYKMKIGGSNHSFGINVAKMAGIPFPVIERAQYLMNELSNKNFNLDENSISQNQYQLKIFDENENQKKLKEKLRNINIDKTSPIEALIKLNELKNFLENLSENL